MSYKSTEEIVRANKAAGGCWFDPGWMHLFGCRIGKAVYGGRYFISSELDYDRKNRRYTIRLCDPEGNIKTIGDFRGFATSHQARAEIRRLVTLQEKNANETPF